MFGQDKDFKKKLEPLDALKSASKKQSIAPFPLPALVFIFFSFFYIILEFSFNYMLIEQMGVATSDIVIKQIEDYGKVLSGIGIGLLITKIFLDRRGANLDFYLPQMLMTLFITTIIGVIISFFLQTAIIKSIVKVGSDEDKAKSILIAQANNTIVPYYQHNAPNSIFSEITADEFYKSAQECRDAGHGVKGVESKLEKVLYPYTSLRSEFDEKRYLDIVKPYNSCMVEKLVVDKIEKPRNYDVKIPDVADELYQQYENMNKRHNSDMAIHAAASEGRGGRGPDYRVYKGPSKGTILHNWDAMTKSHFGFDAKIPPNLTRSAFLNHKDIKPLLVRQKTRKIDVMGEFNKRVDEVRVRANDELVFQYFAHRDLIPEVDKSIKYKGLEWIERADGYADDAYKSIVLPVVILFFSVFFLILNIVSLGAYILARIGSQFVSPKYMAGITNIAVFLIAAGLFIYPALKNSTADSKLGRFTEYVFFYESKLIEIYEHPWVKKNAMPLITPKPKVEDPAE